MNFYSIEQSFLFLFLNAQQVYIYIYIYMCPFKGQEN